MAFEIELKARVADSAAVARALGSFAECIGPFDKKDAYYRKPEGDTWLTVRIRQVDGKAVVTTKKKKLIDDIEVNEEIEFDIPDVAAFGSFLEAIGFAFAYAKRKKGMAYRHGEVLCELCEIEGLGMFIELEIIADDRNAETVTRSVARLKKTLGLAGVGESAIESRFYSDLLGYRIMAKDQLQP